MGTIITIVLGTGLTVYAVWAVRRVRRQGTCSSCEGCAMAGQCHRQKTR